MADKVRPSFDQHIAKRGEPADLAKSRAAYDAAVKKLAGMPTSDADYQKARDAKRDAGIALSNARQKAEADFYAEEIKENVEVITTMKEEAAKAVRHHAR